MILDTKIQIRNRYEHSKHPPPVTSNDNAGSNQQLLDLLMCQGAAEYSYRNANLGSADSINGTAFKWGPIVVLSIDIGNHVDKLSTSNGNGNLLFKLPQDLAPMSSNNDDSEPPAFNSIASRNNYHYWEFPLSNGFLRLKVDAYGAEGCGVYGYIRGNFYNNYGGQYTLMYLADWYNKYTY